MGIFSNPARDEQGNELRRRKTDQIPFSIIASDMTVIGDLADYAQPDEGVPLSRRVIACIEGRGPFDRLVNAMLVQLLAQNGNISKE